MLPIYQQNTQANIAVDFPDSDAGIISPTAISFRVTDEVGSVIVEDTSFDLTGVDGSQITIGINPEFNLIEDDRVRAMRVLTCVFTAPTGQHTTTTRYVIEKVSKLILMTNSFQTFEEALLTRFNLPVLDGWDMGEEAAQVGALATAFDRMCRLSYRYMLNQNAVMYNSRDPYWIVNGIRFLTPNDFAGWPSDFKQALRNAQLFEADQILKGDPVGDKRRSGVISETIGEAKMFFNAKPPLRLALCEQAMEALTGHIHANRRVGRA